MRVSVRYAGKDTVLEMSEDTTVLEFKTKITDAVGVRVEQQKLLAGGKTCADTALLQEAAPNGKLMLLKSAAAASKRVTFIWAGDVRGRCVRHVPIDGDLCISQLCDIARSALRVQGETECALFWAGGKMLLRPELSVADYPLADQCELFLFPLPRKEKRVASATEAGEATAMAAAAEAFLSGRLQLSALQDLANKMVPSSTAAAAPKDDGGSEKSDEQTGDGDATTCPTAVPTNVPSTLRTGFGFGHASASGQELESLRAAATVLAVTSAPPPTLQPESTGDGCYEADGWSEAQREWVESQCSKMVGSLVGSLRPEQPPHEEAAKLGQEPNHQPARRGGAAKSTDKFGAGLAKGFLNAPRRRRKPATPTVAPAVAAASAGTESRCARNACKACGVRLPLTAYLGCGCKCGHVFCAAHLHEHDCPFDHRAIHKRKLAAANPKLSAPKLDTAL